MLLCIDSGFTHCGWAVIDPEDDEVVACGCIRTESAGKKSKVRVADSDAERCAIIARGLNNVYETYCPSAVICELPHSGGQGARPIACMARAGAIVATLVEVWQLPAEWVTPTDVKMVTGKKGASKEEVAAVVRNSFEFDWPATREVSEHVFDACASYLAARDGNLVRTLKKRYRE